jgi:diguanylate cyclase (GGDEF)-like protein
MFMPVAGLSTAASSQHQQTPVNDRYYVSIVLLYDYLLSDLDITQQPSVGMLLYHNDLSPDDPLGWLFNRPVKHRSLLPKFQYEANLEASRRGFVMKIEQYFGPESISKDLLLATFAISLTGFLFIRLYILRRYSQDIERAREDALLEIVENNDTTITIPNRELLLELLQDGIAKAGQAQVAIVHLDLEDFKQVNEWYGYRTGDLVLQNVALRIQKCLSRDDQVLRLRGDEFLVLVTGRSSGEELEKLIDRLRKAVRSPISIGDRVIFVRASIGSTRYPGEGVTLEEALDAAENAMRQDKMSRRGSTPAR